MTFKKTNFIEYFGLKPFSERAIERARETTWNSPREVRRRPKSLWSEGCGLEEKARLVLGGFASTIGPKTKGERGIIFTGSIRGI